MSIHSNGTKKECSRSYFKTPQDAYTSHSVDTLIILCRKPSNVYVFLCWRSQFKDPRELQIYRHWLSTENAQWILSYIGLHTTPIPLKILVLKRHFVLHWKAIKNSLREQWLRKYLPRNLSLNTWVSMGNVFSVSSLSVSFLQSWNKPCLWHLGRRHFWDNLLCQCLYVPQIQASISTSYLLVFNKDMFLDWCVLHKSILRISLFFCWRQ